MNNSHIVSRRNGLTPLQWTFLVVAFIVGLGSTFVIREIFPPAHAGVTSTTLSSGVSAK